MPDPSTGPLIDSLPDDDPDADPNVLPSHYRVTPEGRLRFGNPGHPWGWRPLDEADARLLRAADGVLRQLTSEWDDDDG